MLNQAKIDLAVLYKLYVFAEHDWDAPTPTDLAKVFDDASLSVRRIEVSLGELESRGHAESYPDPSAGVYRWQITRDGFGVVDRALRVPASFIARIAANGSDWLSSDEAAKAVLKKLNAASESNDSSAIEPANEAIGVRVTINWTMWGTVLAGIGVLVSILIAVFS